MAGKSDRSVARSIEPALVITRIFDTPACLVWKAWTEFDKLPDELEKA